MPLIIPIIGTFCKIFNSHFFFAIFAIWEKLQNLILVKSKNLFKSIKITKLNTCEIWLMYEGPFWSKLESKRLLAPDRFCKKDENRFCFFPRQCFALAFSLKTLLHLQSFQNGRPRKSKTRTIPLQIQGPQCIMDHAKNNSQPN